MRTSNLYELVVVLAAALTLSAAILGWTSVKTEGRKIICTWDGRFGRIKMLYLGVSSLAVFVILVENLNTLYRLLGANREESIAVAYGLILGTVGLTVLLQSAIIRFSGKWHRLKLTEQLYRELRAERKMAQRAQRAQAKPATKDVRTPQPQQVRRGPDRHPGPRRHEGIFDQELGRTIYPGEEKVVGIHSRQAVSEDAQTSAEDMRQTAEAVSVLATDTLMPPLDVKEINLLLLAASKDGSTRSVAELGDPTKLPDPDQDYKENPGWTYCDYPKMVDKESTNEAVND